jgi:hypothetical protein
VAIGGAALVFLGLDAGESPTVFVGAVVIVAGLLGAAGGFQRTRIER